ncbi:hypothetical protein DN757_20640 [Paenibacillus silvae]|uniref:Uncharacterized protein n=1 Tax=Paenibacillus silvae TaxID=1325358 RepID=A0A2W6P6M1_9BACL|nr:hypothetical protein DN757_20640 [Paenibacillus silvae]
MLPMQLSCRKLLATASLLQVFSVLSVPVLINSSTYVVCVFYMYHFILEKHQRNVNAHVTFMFPLNELCVVPRMKKYIFQSKWYDLFVYKTKIIHYDVFVSALKINQAKEEYYVEVQMV